MADFEKYYDEELRYLKEGGEEFAEAFPERARYLNLSAVEDRDPYVERLFEGFAFLTGRIRQKLDDDFPEFSRSLMEMIDPLFLRPIPSIAMLQIGFRETLLPNSVMVEKGTLFLSPPVGPQASVCRFQSTKPVRILPLNLTSAALTHHPQHGDGCELRFQFDAAAEIANIELNEIEFFVHGERPFAWWLMSYFTNGVSRVLVEAQNRTLVLGGQECVQPGGFGPEEALLPTLDNSFEGSQFLLEYLAFDEKFRFVKIKGLRILKQLGENSEFAIHIYFNQAVPEGRRVKTDNIRLHVTPVVNIFETRAEPVQLNHKHFEYLLTPEMGHQTEIFEVKGVLGMDKSTGKRRDYASFHGFRHTTLADGDETAGGWYQVKQERDGKTGYRTWLSVGQEGKVETWAEEYLSVEILATNGPVPREHLLENSIRNPAPGFSGSLNFTNFTRPSIPIPPPQSKHYLWHVLALMNLNFRSLCQDGVMRDALSLYDWTRSPVNRRLIEGLGKVEAKRKSFLLGGQYISGTEMNLTFKDDSMGDQGERVIVARILLEFFTQYSSINHLVALKLNFSPSGQTIELPPKEGRCHSI
jgi:type VI secretion system protein ImpG